MASDEGARKNGKFMAICMVPDVCKTQVGNAVVPIPYPITSTLSDSMSTSTNVNFGGDPAFIHDKSTITKVTGDEPGSIGGVKSGTNRSTVKPIEGSSSVNVNKKPVVRHGDKCDMNNGNTKGKIVYQGVSKSSGGSRGNSNPPAKAETKKEEQVKEEQTKGEKKGFWSKASPWVHGVLDVAGFVPGLGAIPDLANAGIYALEGDAAMTSLSLVAAVPLFGDGIKAGSIAYKGGKAIVKHATKKTAKKLAKEAAEKTEKEIAEKAVKEKVKKEAAKKTAKETAEKATKKKGKKGVKESSGKKKKKKKDPCKALENGVPGEKYKGGKYSKIKKGGAARGQEAHHMPADSASPVKQSDGPAIQMDKADHGKTASYDNKKEAKAFRGMQKNLMSKGKAGMLAAMMMDIADIKSKFGNKYDSAIAQMMLYAKCKGQI